MNKILCLLILMPIVLFPQITSIENRRLFGDFLFQEGDYLRAIEEYKSVYSVNGNDTLIFRSGIAYSNLRRFSEAEDVYRKLFNNDVFSKYARINLIADKLKQNDLPGFSRSLDNEFIYPDTGYSSVRKLQHLLKYDKYLPDTLIYPELNENEYDAFKKLYILKKSQKQKSPKLAAIMSAVLPGSGKIYTKDYSDGITAFVVNGLLAYLAYDNITNERPYRAVIFTGLSAWFYAGNIYGSYTAAQIYNARQREQISVNVYNLLKEFNYFVPEFRW